MSPEEMERDKVTDRRTSLLDAWPAIGIGAGADGGSGWGSPGTWPGSWIS
jgi:hypothetical protein